MLAALGVLVVASLGRVLAQPCPSRILHELILEPYPRGDTVRAAATADFDGDGLPDVAAAMPNAVGIALGSGGFAYGSLALLPGSGSDFNSDAALDVMIASNNSKPRIRFGDGSGSFGPPERSSVLTYEDSTSTVVRWRPSPR